MKRGTWIAWTALVCAAACSDSYVAGNYSAQMTNRSDGCSLGLTTGENVMVGFSVTQSDSDVTLEVGGLPGLFLAAQVGAAVLTGDVDGDEIDLGRQGTVTRMADGCEFTINAALRATQDGDGMSGRVEYRAATNGHPDCGSRESCVTVQDFNATRPPAPE